MSKKYILRSKWFLSMAVLLLFATSNAQEITKEKEPARFGIGIAYGFKDRVKELIHPIELTVRYNLSEKHSFYVNVPLGWKSWRDDYASVDPSYGVTILIKCDCMAWVLDMIIPLCRIRT